MKKFLLASTALLSLALIAPHASAAPADTKTRAAQMRLAELGYYPGAYDGVLGSNTRNALIHYQRVSGLPITGRIDANTETYLFGTNDYVPYTYRFAYGAPVYAVQSSYDDTGYWSRNWHTVKTNRIPVRFGKLDLNEDRRGSIRHYTVTLNGQPIFSADNQPSILRTSKVYSMAGEDAVIFTAFHGAPNCPSQHYLVTVRADGTFVGPKAIGNCSEAFDARVANNALFVSFPNTAYEWQGHVNWHGEDVWRYENTSLVRL
jgi:peptidoglycan hydrolase-like protein with peptidoglycan-binding domain